MTVKFKVLALFDPRKTCSDLEIGNIYYGEQIDEWRVRYTDKANVDWTFYIGDTCEILTYK